MTKVILHLAKGIEQNASVYYDKAKKIKKKIEGAKAALEENLKKLAKLEKKQAKDGSKVQAEKVKRKKEWYEKFRWFYSSEGFLVIGGRDATTNEIIIKKHTDKDDVVFHTDMAGSPFFVVKTESKDVGDDTLEETAQATASYSRAWKLGLATSDVFHVKPEQVSKEAKAGEFMAKGSFMIMGKTTYIHPTLEIAVGVKDNIVIGGPVNAVKSQTDKYVIIKQGSLKPSDIAKKIKKRFDIGDIDDIIRMLPAGGCSL